MNHSGLSVAVACLGLVTAIQPGRVSAASLHAIDYFNAPNPLNQHYSAAYGVSADGWWAVGTSSTNRSFNGEASRWSLDGTEILPGIGAIPPSSVAADASADGSVIVGSGNLDGGRNSTAFRWENGAVVFLGDLPGGDVKSAAQSVSADGSVIVGESSSAAFELGEAFRWENGVMTPLGVLTSGDVSSSQAYDVSADGSVIVGRSTAIFGTGGPPQQFTFIAEAFRWQNSTMVGLGDLEGGVFNSRANGISDDGTTIIGSATSASGMEPVRWLNGGLTPEPFARLADGTAVIGEATGVTADGSVIVGSFGIWDAVHGVRSMEDFLVNEWGLDLSGWQLESVEAISARGETIVGRGIGPLGVGQGWVATTLSVPEPTALLGMALGCMVLGWGRGRGCGSGRGGIAWPSEGQGADAGLES